MKTSHQHVGKVVALITALRVTTVDESDFFIVLKIQTKQISLTLIGVPQAGRAFTAICSSVSLVICLPDITKNYSFYTGWFRDIETGT